MRIEVMAAVAILVLLVSSRAGAELYRWVDKDGHEFYTNDPEKIPEAFRDRTALAGTDERRVTQETKQTVQPVYSSGAGPGHRDKNDRGEEWWRRRAENLRIELRDLEDEYDLVLRKEQDQEKRQTANGKSGKKKKLKSFDAKKMQLDKKIAQVKRRLEVDLPEEARKAGAYPGWIRE